MPIPILFQAPASNDLRIAGYVNGSSTHMNLVAYGVPVPTTTSNTTTSTTTNTTTSTNATSANWMQYITGNITFPIYYIYIGAVAIVGVFIGTIWMIKPKKPKANKDQKSSSSKNKTKSRKTKND